MELNILDYANTKFWPTDSGYRCTPPPPTTTTTLKASRSDCSPSLSVQQVSLCFSSRQWRIFRSFSSCIVWCSVLRQSENNITQHHFGSNSAFLAKLPNFTNDYVYNRYNKYFFYLQFEREMLSYLALSGWVRDRFWGYHINVQDPPVFP